MTAEKRAKPGVTTPRPGTTATARPSATASQTIDRPVPGSLPLAFAEIEESVPVSVERVGPGGRWLAACVARTDSDKNGRLAVEIGPSGAFLGDTLLVELVVGGRKPEVIDDFYAHAPNGRVVAFRRGEKSLLRDLDSGTEVDLATLDWDARDDALPRGSHRALAFDPRGEILAYVRRRAGRSEVVLRTLATGAERTVTDLPGEPHRIAWDGTGEQLVVSAVADDTSGNGKLDWPAPAAKGPRLTCSGPLPRLRATPEIGDRPSTFVVPRTGGSARFVPDFAAPFGASVVVRSQDGELLLAAAGGRRALTTASCGARILFADPARGLLLVACPGKNPQRAGVELVGAGYRLELGVEVQPTSIDAWPDQPKRLVPVYPGTDALVVDLERRVTIRLEPGDQVIATSGPRALVRRRGSVVVLDVEKNTTKTLAAKLPPLPAIVTQGTLAVVGVELFDVREDSPLGAVSGRPLALTAFGDVLVARGNPPSAERLATGPLRWERPPTAKTNLGAGARMVR
jgi:hypothetical protein